MANTFDVARAVAETRALFAQNRMADVERLCARILDADPRQADALYGLGLVRVRAGRYAEAASYLGRVLEQSPDDVTVLVELGTALLNDERPAQAIEVLARATRLDSTDANAHFNLANGYLASSKFIDAIRHYRVALALSGESGPVLLNLATALTAAGEPAEALEACERAGQAGLSNTAELAVTRGCALRELGRADEAEASFRRAAQLNPDLGAARDALASAPGATAGEAR